MKKRFISVLLIAAVAIPADGEVGENITQKAEDPSPLQTRYAQIRIDQKGFIVSLTSRASGKEYGPAGHPSPLLSLPENGNLVLPQSAVFLPGKNEVELKYPNGATAVVKAEAKDTHFRFQLVSLTPRGSVDNIVWGPLHTNISKIIGDLIGVVRDDNWAVGMLGLDDNTIAGPVVDGDCYGMGYYIHSPDPVKYPVPPKYKEGERFGIGGSGHDIAFYSRPEEYFQMFFGTGAKLEPEFGSTVAYHARDRRKSYTAFFSLMPSFGQYAERHMQTDPVDVDFMGSSIALYACPDDLGLATIEKVILAEGLPHIVIDGKWIRDPSSFRPTVYWKGVRDKCIEYTKALGLKDISQETDAFFPALGNNADLGNVKFSGGRKMKFKEFTEEAHKHGLTHGGLHTLCLFLQYNRSNDVTPFPTEHLQTVLRTKLAKDISLTDTEIVVTDPSFLAERGTWPKGNSSNFLRIGREMLTYAGISETAPWTLKGVKRSYHSPPQAHKAGDELVKLQQNCYNGYVPDIKRMLDYADYYAELMYRNGMDTINFDGFESTVYQGHGYYGTRIFCRRLFETYAKLTGGKAPRVTGSNVFSGAWEYMNVCDLGSGDHMFNAISGRRGTEGKDIGTGFSNSYYPATFGIQSWHPQWSLYEAENLQAKAVGWEATYALSMSQGEADASGDRDAIFKAFRAWENARASGAFTKEMKERLRDPDFKFHLEQSDDATFVLFPIRESRSSGAADSSPKELAINNPYEEQPLQFSLRFLGPTSGVVCTLPNGKQIKCDGKIETAQLIIYDGKQAYLADKFRKKISDLALEGAAMLPAGASKIGVQFPRATDAAKTRFEFTVSALGKSEELRASGTGRKESL